MRLQNVKVAQQLLKRLGHSTVDVACDGQAAIEACQSRRYDIVLMDVLMPRVDGLEATRTLHNTFPDHVNRPYIIVCLTFLI